MVYQFLFGFVILSILLLLIFAKQLLLWFSAKVSGASVALPDVLGLRFSPVSTEDVMRGIMLCKKAGLDVSLTDIKKAALEGANIQNVVLGMVAADQAGQTLTITEAVSLDKQGVNIIHHLKTHSRT